MVPCSKTVVRMALRSMSGLSLLGSSPWEDSVALKAETGLLNLMLDDGLLVSSSASNSLTPLLILLSCSWSSRVFFLLYIIFLMRCWIRLFFSSSILVVSVNKQNI